MSYFSALIGMTNVKLEMLSSDIKHLTRLQQLHENITEENEIVSTFPVSSMEKLIELNEMLKEENTFSEVVSIL